VQLLTWGTFFEMPAEPFSVLGIAFTVDELPYLCDQFGALGLDARLSTCRGVTGRKLSHDDTSSGA
jgi:hypothetical protein